ncbi:TatD family hydrolase [Solilutibacter silvestris]|uniref:Mg-dependent DNase n=1 Tax=Solilutibacter silvestris TaxID=1645665 RepID=A0A2K1PYB6_9GAMM|nr:TatD family hydrolase [Lysobacter silvestris]PNS07782.1 Mg-dependent DNase [Lysobacter silvestris]
MQLFDSHSHIDVDAFDADRDAVMARARDAGIIGQLVPAIAAAGWPHLREVCVAFPHELYPAYGMHPMFLDEHRPEHLEQLRHWLSDERCVAVGEIGLDYFIETLDRGTQQFYFDAQLRLAREFDLPVIVHARRAVDATIASLKKVGGLRGIIHSFGGSTEQARQLWQMGFLLGIGGPVTYPRAQRLRELVATMPLEQLVLETDSPDQPDAQWRGQRNEPARLTAILATVAELRDESSEVIAAATTANAMGLLKLSRS